jgi:uncharacterized protein YsxB (DUF464 family)
MIVVEFPEPIGGELKFKVNGHAGKSDKGQDIVCAAVSTLTQTLAGGIQSGLGASVCGRLESGDTDLMIQVAPEKGEDLKLICNVFRFGFQKICESYPEHVKMI